MKQTNFEQASAVRKQTQTQTQNIHPSYFQLASHCTLKHKTKKSCYAFSIKQQQSTLLAERKLEKLLLLFSCSEQ